MSINFKSPDNGSSTNDSKTLDISPLGVKGHEVKTSFMNYCTPQQTKRSSLKTNMKLNDDLACETI